MSALAEHRPGSDHNLDGRSEHGPASLAARLRADFGAHLEADYPRLVAQLYAITLDAGEAHDAVQDAYSRAWRDWVAIRRSHDPAAWVRSVAVRSTIRSWRRLFARTGVGAHRSVGAGTDPRTAAMLSALGRLPAAERRAVVLFHMAGVSLGEIAAIEGTSADAVAARLAHGQHVVTGGMADVLPDVHDTDAVPGPEGLADPGRPRAHDARDYLPAGYGAYADFSFGDEPHADYPVGYDPPGYLGADALEGYRAEVHYPERYDLGLSDLDGHGSARGSDGPSADRPSADRPSAGRPSADQPSADGPSADDPGADRHSADRHSAEGRGPDTDPDTDPDGHSDRSASRGVLTGPDTREHR